MRFLDWLLGKWWKRFLIDLAWLAAVIWSGFNLPPNTNPWPGWPTWVFGSGILFFMVVDAVVTFRRRQRARV